MATISQRISLEGGDDIRKQLEELAKTAAAAFKQVTAAAEKVQVDPATEKAFADLAEAGSKLADQFGELGQAAAKSAPQIEEVGKAAEAAGDGFAKVGEEGDKAAKGITAVADASKQTTTEVTKSGEAAEKSSTGYANLALNIVRTGASVVTAGAGIAQAGAATAAVGVQAVGAAAAVGTFALSLGSTLVAGIGAAIAGFGLLASALERIAFSDARLSETLARLAFNVRGIKQSFTDLQVGQQAFAQIGVSAEKFRTIIAGIAEQLGKFDAGAAFTKSADAITSATQKVLEAEKKLIEAQITLDAAGGTQATFQARMRLLDINRELEAQQTELAKAQKAAAEAQAAADAARGEKAKALANDLRNLVDIIRQVEAGAKGVTFGDTTAEARLDAVKARLKEIATAGGDVSKALLKIIANLPKPEAFEIGKAFGFSDTDIDRVRRYGAEVTKIDGLFAKIRGAGVLISPETATVFEKMNESTQRLDSAWERLKQAWASTIFSNLAAQATTAFNNMTASVVEFTAQVLESFNMLGSQLMTTLGQIVSGWGTIFGMIGSGLATIGSQILQGWAIIGQGIANAFSDAMASIGAMIGEAAGAISTFVTTAVGSAWQWIVDTFNSAVTSLRNAASQAMAGITAFVTTPISGAWQWIVDAWNAMLAKLGIGGGGGGKAAGGEIPGAAGGGLLRGRGTGTSDSNLAWVSRGEYIIPARIVQRPGMLAFLEALRLQRFAGGGLVPAFAEGGSMVPGTAVQTMIDRALGMIDRIIDTIIQANDGIIGGLIKIGDEIFKFADNITNEIKQVMGAFAQNIKSAMEQFSKVTRMMADFSKSIDSKASGGLLGGRGTGTSDSNLAWVSRGEHIMPAAAVRQPGVLAFLEALRRSGGNLRDVLDGMGRFALGGLVAPTLSIPAFAGGGMNNVTIQFPGLPEITGLRASSGVVDELRKAAAMAQVRSGGRKPSRYS